MAWNPFKPAVSTAAANRIIRLLKDSRSRIPKAQTANCDSPATGRRAERPWRTAALIFLIHLGIYQINCDVLPGGDATCSTYLPALLMTRGSFSVTPTSMPVMFLWHLRTAQGITQIRFTPLGRPDRNFHRRPTPAKRRADRRRPEILPHPLDPHRSGHGRGHVCQHVRPGARAPCPPRLHRGARRKGRPARPPPGVMADGEVRRVGLGRGLGRVCVPRGPFFHRPPQVHLDRGVLWSGDVRLEHQLSSPLAASGPTSSSWRWALTSS